MFVYVDPYRNTWPEVFYCCVTRTTMFNKIVHVIIRRDEGFYHFCSPSFVTLHLLKSMRIPSFVLIGCCVSESCGNLCPYHNIWPEAVYCCFTRTTLFSELLLSFEMLLSITSPSFVALNPLISEMVKCIA